MKNYSRSWLALTPAPAAAGGWYNNGALVSVGAAVNAGYSFSAFSGALTGGTNPQAVTMSAPRTVTANFVSLPLVTLTLRTSPVGWSITHEGTTCTDLGAGGIVPNQTPGTTIYLSGPGTGWKWAYTNGGADACMAMSAIPVCRAAA